MGDRVQEPEILAENLKSDPSKFLDHLRHSIKCGEEKCHYCMKLFHFLIDKNVTNILENDREDQSILHLAASYHNCSRLICLILRCCPSLALAERTGSLQGQTFLHILALKSSSEPLRACLTSCRLDEEVWKNCLGKLAVGERFKNTPLMGETVLSAAALKGNIPCIHMLLSFSVPLNEKNSKGDTVFHSLIRYAHQRQDEEEKETVIETLKVLNDIMLTRSAQEWINRGRDFARMIWFTENKNKQTPLQLAAELGEGDIFNAIMDLPKVYRDLLEYDGLCGIYKYDVTEVDTVAKMEWEKAKLQKVSGNSSVRKNPLSRLKDRICGRDSYHSRKASPAILETVCEANIDEAITMISSPAVQQVVTRKWKSYRTISLIWAAFHFFFMLGVTIYAEHKVLYIEDLQNETILTREGKNGSELIQNVTDVNSPSSHLNKTSLDYSPTFIGGFHGFIFVPVALSLYLEASRTFIQGTPWRLHLAHHNGKYRLLLLILNLSLLADGIWFAVDPATNPKPLIVMALCAGWWFCLFFLRPYRKFSYFTVMMQKVLFGDMFRFSTFILIQLLTFTFVMRLLFIHNHPAPLELEDFQTSLLTMFKLMLGLGELSILQQGDPFWLATVLFVSFLLLTYVLLMNSLIAMLSDTCSMIVNQRFQLWQIQRLSVVLFLEQHMVTFGLATKFGKKNQIDILRRGNEHAQEDARGDDGEMIMKGKVDRHEEDKPLFQMDTYAGSSPMALYSGVERNAYSSNLMDTYPMPSSPMSTYSNGTRATYYSNPNDTYPRMDTNSSAQRARCSSSLMDISPSSPMALYSGGEKAASSSNLMGTYPMPSSREATYSNNPEDTYPKGPIAAYSGGQRATNSSNPVDTYPSSPMATYSGGTRATYSSNPEDTYPSSLMATYSGGTRATYSSNPEDTYPSSPTAVYSSGPRATYSSNQEDTYPSSPIAAYSGGPRATYSSNQEDTYPSSPMAAYSSGMRARSSSGLMDTYPIRPMATYSNGPGATYSNGPRDTYSNGPRATYSSRPGASYSSGAMATSSSSRMRPNKNKNKNERAGRKMRYCVKDKTNAWSLVDASDAAAQDFTQYEGNSDLDFDFFQQVPTENTPLAADRGKLPLRNTVP